MPPKKKKANQAKVAGEVKDRRTDTQAVLSAARQPHSESRQLPKDLLQLVLNVFSNTFSTMFNSDLPSLIQQMKKHLYNRDFDSAFRQQRFLEAYTVRWSPSRALAYSQILCNLPTVSASILSGLTGRFENGESQVLTETTRSNASDVPHPSSNIPQDFDGLEGGSSRIVCIGAGAGAEVVALGASLNYLEKFVSDQQNNSESVKSLGNTARRIKLDVTAIDIADWEPVILRLYSGITTAPPLSSYAPAEVKAINEALAEPFLYNLRFLQQDILKMEDADLAATFTDAKLVALMFTLNELYSCSIAATTNLLLSMTTLLSPGALLLVIDSPGSYSTVKLGTASDESKRYPMQWLLDHTLLDSAAIGSSKDHSTRMDQWNKLETRGSEWFRLPKGLIYPITLEDMRYQLHLYRRI